MLIAAFGFVLGACVGSFLNVCIDRLPKGRSLITPPSHCDACGNRLRGLALIPVVSYLWLRGRCRYCGAAIPWRILAVEVATGFLFAFVVATYGFDVQFLVLAFYTCLFLILAVIDLEYGLILNKITYPAIVISLILAPFWSSFGFLRAPFWENSMLQVFLSSLGGAGIYAIPFLLIVLFYPHGLGWGDVKMAVLIGLATGLPLVLVAMMIAFLSGGLVASFLLLLHLKRRKEAMPFGPFLSLGALVALFWGKDIITVYLRLWW
ncbi:MAG: prepilin peptidase [Dehalococcoidia bacterium]|nr:prepilin peptidase [Dehalococcoidia bacterium]